MCANFNCLCNIQPIRGQHSLQATILQKIRFLQILLLFQVYYCSNFLIRLYIASKQVSNICRLHLHTFWHRFPVKISIFTVTKFFVYISVRMPILGRLPQVNNKPNNKDDVKPSTSHQTNDTGSKTAQENVKLSNAAKPVVPNNKSDAPTKSSVKPARRVTRSQSHHPPTHEPAQKCQKHEPEHPYIQKIDAKLDKLHTLINGIFQLADNNLIIAGRDTGINNYDMQFKFAEKLDNIGADLKQLIKDCSDKATEVRSKIFQFQDHKHSLQDSYFVEEITKASQKVQEYQKPNPSGWIRDETVLIKREHYATTISDESSDEDHDIPQAGDMDTKFTYRKKNSNEELLHNYGCEDCDEVFRDRQELRNHESTHHKELYRCLRCDTVCRSVRSFTNHTKTDHLIIFHCPYPDCNDSFLLKTSLINHEQKHSNFRYTCNLATCAKKFKYRATYLEHINYRHRESKSVPCPVCKKMYWTPSDMRSHRAKIHGLVTEMYRGAI